MSVSPQDLGDQWQGLEPEQPRSSRAAFWVALLAAILLLLGIVALSVFLFNMQPETGETAVSVDNGDVANPVEGESVEPEPHTATEEPLAIAPTATLPIPPSSGTQAAAVRLPSPPTIDANLGEWPGTPSTASEFIVYSATSWDGSDDLAADWQLAWDNDNLYIAVSVTDDIHAQNQTGNTIFRGDSLDMQFDTMRAEDFGPAVSPDDFQITLSPGDFAGLPPSAFRFQGTTSDSMVDAAGLNSIRVAAQPTATGYILEAAIPWQDLNMTPVEGMEIGLSLNATDDDQPGVAIQEFMKSNSPNRDFDDPTTWATLRLE
ncbi:MAG: sugar-binding protein [Chloroflexota bacterium]